MGQGYSSVTLPAGLNLIDSTEISDLHVEKNLGGARFLRTVRARHQNGIVVAKVCMKANQTVSFREYAKTLREQRQILKGVPNVLTYQRVRESSTLGVLVRQYIHTSLYDRISIRPFLEGIEKKWIAFQLLCAVRDCHSRDVFHGDIKSENVLVTSWGWVYLTDFASAYKPVYLPEDNPADFSFYYDTSARRTCYVAPERFLAPGEQPQEGNVVQWNMDIFSVGCVLAELFTEAPTFTLSQLFRYRKGEYDPAAALLSKVDDENVRNLISSMIRLDPGERWHAQDYLDEYKGKAFPLYFYNHLHTLMAEITDPTSGRSITTSADSNNALCDERINMIYHDYEMLSVSLGYQDTKPTDMDAARKQSHLRGLFPLQVDLPNSRHLAHAAQPSSGDNGTFILLNIITSSMRSSARSTSKLRACELLLAFAERLPDEAKLDRVLPYVISLLEDSSEIVLVAALRTMTQLLALVKVVSPVNTFLFTQYIFPRLQAFIKTEGFLRRPLVRATYAACLASLAQTASRFLDIMQALRADGSLPAKSQGTDDPDDYAAYQDAYDSTRLDILDQFEAQTKVFLTDTDNSVRRAFLTSVSSLCVFFGEARASDVLLTHLNTYLNDQDWLLKCAFFRTIVGVAVFIGPANLEEFILPLMLQAITDPQEFVVEQALRSLASMAEMGLLQRTKTWELIDTLARFQMHPNLWIKEAAAHFIGAATTYLSAADIRILTAPLIQPYLKIPVTTLNETELLDALKKPVPRAVLDLALQWAGKVEKGVFWKSAKDSKLTSSRSTVQMPPQSSVADLGPKALARVPKTVEDEQWLGRLRNAGMRTEDEMKILAFREYLWRAAQRARTIDNSTSDPLFEQIIRLTKLNITPQTVIFDQDVRTYERHIEAQDRTIAEALEEASHPTKEDGSHEEPTPSEAGTTITTVNGSGPRLELPAGINSPANAWPTSNAPRSLSSSPSSAAGLLGKDIDRRLHHKPSAAALLGASDGRTKTRAEVATDEATATGRLNLPTSPTRGPSPGPASDERGGNGNGATRPAHNYAGNDPTVLRLLDAVYVDKFPIDVADFGPFVQYKAGAISTNSAHPSQLPWRPQGDLVAVLSEHVGRIVRIVSAPDHAFVLTASEDGTVKVWDSARLERNVTHRSRQTYRLAPGAKVTSLCFVHSTYTFICTGSDGSVHAVKVDVSDTNSGLKYNKLRVLREWHIPKKHAEAEYAVWTEHFRGEGGSTLVLATNLGRILVIDLRYMSITYDMRVSASHGEPTAFCMGRRHDWLLVGTSLGVLELWDLRFQLLLRTMSFANAAPISRLQLHPSRNASRRNKFCVTGGTGPGEVSVWDIEKMICNDVFRVPRADSKDRLQLRDYELFSMEDDKDKPNSLLSRVSAADQAQAAEPPVSLLTAFVGIQLSLKDSDRDNTFIITGGPDKKVRFWDCERLEGCRLVNGGAPDEKPTYTLSQLGLDIKVFTEKSAEDGRATGNAVESNKVGPSPKKGSKDGASTSRPTSRYETIRLSAQNLLNGHLDTITDVALLERPFGMILSGDRSGRVFVYQ